MKIANIIYENELVNHTKVDYVNYINKAVPYMEIDKTLPTLYVGWDFMKSCNLKDDLIQNADILKKRIVSGELYWEFSFDEHKSSHVNGVSRFINKLPEIYFRFRYKYIDLDPIFFQITDVDELFDVLPKKIEQCYNYKNEMLYLLNADIIYGVNINTYNYFKFPKTDIFNRVIDRTNNIIIDEVGDIYSKYNKIFPNFNMLRRYMVVILSK